MRIKTGKAKRLNQIVLYCVITIITLIFIMPFIYVIYTSLRETGDIIKNGFLAPIAKVHLENYAKAWFSGRLNDATLNSLVITIPALAIMMVLSSAAGYALACMEFRFKSAVFILVMAGLYLPVAVKLLPVYLLYNRIGWTDSYAGIIAVHVASAPFCVFFLRNFYITIPKELKEAAIIDGCSYPAVFPRIYFPLSKPSLAVLTILQFTTVWNSFIWELLLMTSKTPIMVAVMSLQGQYSIDWAIQCAGAIIASIPTIIIFFVFQRYFISGLTAGAVKG